MASQFAIPPITPDVRSFGSSAANRRIEPRSSFESELLGAVDRLEKGNQQSSDLIGRFLRGENVELHTVALSAQKAQTSFELFLQVRNKLVQGFQEIMHMQI